MNGTDTTAAERALAEFTPGTGRWRIAEALLTSGRWMYRAELMAIGRVAGTAVPEVALKLRSCGIDVRHVRDQRDGQAMYLVPQHAEVAA